MARPRAFRYFFSWSRLDNSCCLHTRKVAGQSSHTQSLAGDQTCALYSLKMSFFHIFSHTALLSQQAEVTGWAQAHVLRPSLLSDTRMDSTFGEVHLSSTASVCSVGDRQSIRNSPVLHYYLSYVLVCSLNIAGLIVLQITLSPWRSVCLCASYLSMCSSCLACSSAISISVTS